MPSLAEDEKEMSAALVAILTIRAMIEADAVYDGQAAVDKALVQSYDCMILDIMMPKKTASRPAGNWEKGI